MTIVAERDILIKVMSAVPNHPFCDFVAEFYSSSANSLTSLCDCLGLNINILLFCCWTAKIGHKRITRKEIESLIAAISPWHRTIVTCLQRMRKKISTYDISAIVLDKENIANKFEQMILADSLRLLPGNRSEEQKAFIAYHNIVTYCNKLQIRLNKQDNDMIKNILIFLFPRTKIKIKQDGKYVNLRYLQSELGDLE